MSKSNIQEEKEDSIIEDEIVSDKIDSQEKVESDVEFNKLGDNLLEDEIFKKKKNKLKKEAEQLRAKIEQSGVLYMSSVPPRMTKQKLKKLLSIQSVPIGRIHLAKESQENRELRKKKDSGSRVVYTEAWIEFSNKSRAKALAKILNNTPMDPNRRSFHHDFLWTLKYLPKFKWHHLTERIDYEREIRQQRIRAEEDQAIRINNQYIERVEQSKKFARLDAKRQDSNDEPSIKIMRSFAQHIPQDLKDATNSNLDAEKDLTSVLDNIFN